MYKAARYIHMLPFYLHHDRHFNSRYTKIGFIFLNTVNGNYLSINCVLNVRKIWQIDQNLTILGPEKLILKRCQKQR
jgi:hypothetical protein